MYRIKMVPQTIGVKSCRKTRYYTEKFERIKDAIRVMNKCIEEQIKLSWQQIGMLNYKTKKIENGVILEIYPALTLYKALRITFTVEAETDA